MHKIISGRRFIIAGKKCINKQLSKYATSAFKLLYSSNRCILQKKHKILAGNITYYLLGNTK